MTRQGGAISYAQLLGHGLSRQRVSHLLDVGWIHREHRGVYRVRELTSFGILFAAFLAMGAGSAVSHLSAAHFLGYLGGGAPRVVDITSATHRRSRRGIRAHQAPLHPLDVITRNGLRLTSPSRTLLDLAAILTAEQLQVAVDEARVKRQLRLKLIEATIARSPGHHGIGALRRAVARHDPGRGRTRSELEDRARRFLRDRSYPPYDWQSEIRLAGEVFVMDAVWSAHRVILELDGRGFHDNDPRFASDRRKSRRLAAAGWEVVRATWEDFDHHEDELDADLSSIIARRTPRAAQPPSSCGTRAAR